MEKLTQTPRKAVLEEVIENWDNNNDLDIGGENFTSRSASAATTAASHRRDSVSSRLSGRSDFESNHRDEEKHVHLPGGDERSTFDAITTATRAGIPMPHSVPSSTFMGGTIKRLEGKKIKMLRVDCDDCDLDLPCQAMAA
jgi:hypothetical protein